MRGSGQRTGRHCINNSRNTDLDGYKAIMDNENLNNTITAITKLSRGLGRTGEWSWGKAGGDIVDPHTDTYQPLHTDWTGYPLESMVWGFAIVVSVAPKDITEDHAPLRLVGWDDVQRYDDYPQLDSDEDIFYRMSDHLVVLNEGEALIRDCRVCHGGTPDRCDHQRFLPGLQVTSPQCAAYLAERKYRANPRGRVYASL